MSSPEGQWWELCPTPDVRDTGPAPVRGGEEKPLRERQAVLVPEQAARGLRRRWAVLVDKRRLCNCCLCLSVLGIGLMIVTTELCWNGTPTYIIETLRLANTISTLLLIALTVAYHKTSVQLLMIDEGLESWRSALTPGRRACLTLEVLLCLMHPIPFTGCMAKDGSLSTAGVLLSTAVFLRLYWVGRALVLNSPVLNPTYQSLGSLGKVHLHFCFVLKVLMETYAGRMLLIFVTCLWLLASWTLSLCERTNSTSGTTGISGTSGTSRLLESMWLIPITFLTIGYGDVSPLTHCGKFICLLTGTMGVSCTALLIAVVSQKLQLCSDERHIHNFMQEVQLRQQVLRAAVDLISAAWLHHRHGRETPSHRSRECQRHLASALHRFQNAKLQQRRLQNRINAMIGPTKMHQLLHDLNCQVTHSCGELDTRLTILAAKVDNVAAGIEELVSLLRGTEWQVRQ